MRPSLIIPDHIADMDATVLPAGTQVQLHPITDGVMGGSDEEKFDHPTQKPVDLSG
jgi:hypothetical protein